MSYHYKQLGARPIPLPTETIKIFVEYELVPEVVKRLNRLNAIYENDPIEDALKTSALGIWLTNVKGENIRLHVQVLSAPSKTPYAAVLQGKYSPAQKLISLYVNGALSVSDILVPKGYQNRLAPIDECQYVTCLPSGLYRTLLHEMTHAADVITRLKYRAEDVIRAQDHQHFVDYVNDPSEVKAFTRDIQEETQSFVEHIAPIASSQTDLMGKLLSLSTVWQTIERDLTPKNREYILRATYAMVSRKLAK